MMEYIREGGYVMYPLVAIAVAVLVQAIRSWLRMRDSSAAVPRAETGIDAVLFWGAYGVILGVLGTLIGIAQAAQAIESFGGETVSAALVWGGIKVALNTTIFSLLVFSIAFVVWFLLRVRYRRLAAA